jgi:hypothetical protein
MKRTIPAERSAASMVTAAVASASRAVAAAFVAGIWRVRLGEVEPVIADKELVVAGNGFSLYIQALVDRC